MNATGPTESALAMETVDDEERTTMEALRQSGGSIFSAIGFLVGGFYFDQQKFLEPFMFASLLYLISILIFWLHFKGEGPIHIKSSRAAKPAIGS